jgi:SAM-dependent methyltransferase
MKKPLDRITEAYKGDMGEDFGRKTRDRINWIVNQVKGNRILDIGCSQGVVPIILGREGKKVDALDIAQESIDYAISSLEGEHSTVQNNINFKVSNFMTDEQLEHSYETILLTEVLEHISDPISFLKKIHNHIMIEGRLVVTVPFGINDYFDHKRTYYFIELYDHLSSYFTVEKFEFLGKWVGVTCIKNDEDMPLKRKDVFNRSTVEMLEKAFYTIERELLTRVENFQLSIREKNEYIKNIQTQHSQYIEKFKDQVLQRDNQIKILNERINELKNLDVEQFKGIKEEKETNRKLLQQIKDQNIEFNSLIVNVEGQHRRYIEKFEEQSIQKEKEIWNLKEAIAKLEFKKDKNDKEIAEFKENVDYLKIKIDNYEKEINQRDYQIEDLRLEAINIEKNNNNILVEQAEENKKVILALQSEEKKHLEKISVIEKQNIQMNLELKHLNTLIANLKIENHKSTENTSFSENARNGLLQQINEKDQLIQDLTIQVNRFKGELLNSLNSEEKALENSLKEKDQLNKYESFISNLENKIAKLERKYLALKGSKLGSFTLKYWQLRRKYSKKLVKE